MSAASPHRLLVGVGNAGVTILDLLAVENPGKKGLLVVNNDPESLSASVVTERIAVPEGDPGEGFRAIDGEFGRAVSGASSVVLCGGLGGGSGSFLLPALAILAKSHGITVAACVGMPFSFEGRDKKELAEGALEKLYTVCDAVAVIENDRLSAGAPSTTAVGEAFTLSDRTLLASFTALHCMISTLGPVKITRSDLKNVLGIPGTRTFFGAGMAGGPNRLHEALEMAFKSPLLSAPGRTTPGSALTGVPSVLLLLQGPPDLSFAEVQMAVSEIERIAGESCQIKTGVHTDLSAGSPITLSVIASSGGARRPEKSVGTRVSEAAPETDGVPPRVEVLKAPPSVQGSSAQTTTTTSRKTSAKMPAITKQTQGTLDLDTYQRGRFDKSERTIVAGEDLDIPTFLRRGIKLTPPHRN